MIEAIALPPFIYLTVQDYKTKKLKRGVALAFETLAFIAAIIRWDWRVALFLWALGKSLSVVMAYFQVIRLVDLLLFTGYVLLVGNLLWIFLTVAVVSGISLAGLFVKRRFGKDVRLPLAPVLFVLFILYIIVKGVVG